MIIMLNSVVGSLFMYHMNVLRSIPQKKSMKSTQYIGKNGASRVSMEILLSPKNRGGLRLYSI